MGFILGLTGFRLFFISKRTEKSIRRGTTKRVSGEVPRKENPARFHLTRVKKPRLVAEDAAVTVDKVGKVAVDATVPH